MASTIQIYRRVLRYLRPYRWLFITALLSMVAFGASDGVIPFLIKYLLDGVFVKENISLLYLLPVVLLVFSLLRGLFDFAQQYLMSKVGHLVVRDLRNDLNDHLLLMSPGYFVRNSTADLLTRSTSDVLLVRGLLTESLASMIRDTIRVVTLVVAALILDPVLAAIAFIAVPLGFYPIYRFGRRMRKLSRRGQDAIGSLSTILQESMLGNRVVKIFGREEFERVRFQVENNSLTKTFLQSEKIRALSGPVNEILASVAASGVLLYGGYSVINGGRTQGDFVAFLVSVFLLYEPVKRLSRVFSQVQQGMSGAERIFEVLDQRPSIEQPNEPIATPSANSLRFEQVSFSYQGTDSNCLQHISLEIPEGKKIALVGFSGAGKSTLVDLIPRFVDPSSGRVTLGGVDIRLLGLAELRSRIAMVGQHTFLFNDSIYSNIAYGHPAATQASVEEAAKAAYAFDFIQALPHGFATKVGEGGFTLSGGERQRIAIARAVLKDAPILILDEATASLDNRAEREVQAAIEALQRNRTSVVIAHRLSTIRTSDLIVVMKAGQIVEQGSHVELLAHAGEYARLHALQFKEQPAVSPIPQHDSVLAEA